MTYTGGDIGLQEELLQNGAADTEQSIEEANPKDQMNMMQAIFVLTNTITGIGLLSVSYCYRIGVGLNLLISLGLALGALISFILLIDAGEKTKLYDYTKLIIPCFGPKWRNVVNVVIGLTLFGAGILYIQYSGDLLKSVLSGFDGVPKWVLNRWFLIFVPLCVVDLTLSSLKSISMLSNVSFFSMTLVLVYIIHNIFYFGQSVHNEGFDPQHQIKWFDFNNMVIGAIAIQATSYNCHPNIFPALVKLQRPTMSRKVVVMTAVVICAFTIYTSAGLFGYLTLFDQILDPVAIAHYPAGQTFTLIVKAVYAVLLTLTVPLLYWACRLTLNDLIWHSEPTTLRWICQGWGILIAAGLIAVLVENVSVVFSIVGGLFSPVIVYLLPALYQLKLGTRGPLRVTLSWILIFVGFATMILCLYDTIRSWIK